MKARYANWWFGAAVLACWGGLLIAQQVERPKLASRLVTMAAADMTGVRRVVWDADGDPRVNGYSGSQTEVIAGWPGDMRMYARTYDPRTPALQFVREGETVYVRAVPRAVTEDEADEDDNDAHRRRAVAPESLSLPAGVTEIVWPRIHLVVAKSSKAPLPSFTVYAREMAIGGEWSTHLGDALVSESEKRELAPGLLRNLTVYSLVQQSGCGDGSGKTQLRSADISYHGGLFEQLHIYAQAGNTNFSAAEPALQAQLYVTPESGLHVSQVSFLKQIQVHDLPDDKRALLMYPRESNSEVPIAGGCPRMNMKQSPPSR